MATVTQNIELQEEEFLKLETTHGLGQGCGRGGMVYAMQSLVERQQAMTLQEVRG